MLTTDEQQLDQKCMLPSKHKRGMRIQGGDSDNTQIRQHPIGSTRAMQCRQKQMKKSALCRIRTLIINAAIPSLPVCLAVSKAVLPDCKWALQRENRENTTKHQGIFSSSNTAVRMNRTHTHLVRGVFVGAGIQQQPRAVGLTTVRGTHQRSASTLWIVWLK